ncbi:hypothetical protein UCRPA7_5951 [Phaeoacremonium minimum UCRPA7]|uniref:DUF7492 domain-containing protein n=1 Tax=Phaeoacremonium minimum (strain UCR-PA7) TaxID=1286976 RepID=R8BGX1_PHAM7|nr:hypothetical protein UCRPA7_5951 [Phaeoacremonium minimum UCRPA7]EON98590.1 hypothetical protein UCRPA7_5951 [Phaeoacremonium minimum UCRPA7]
MKTSRMGKSAMAAVVLALAHTTSAHTWVEQLMRIASNGTLVGEPGFIRSYTPRTDPAFHDSEMSYLIPPNGRPTGNKILETDNICHPSQTVGTQSAGFPVLTTAPGDFISLRYLENGHVSLPQNQKGKPLNRGTMYIYGTDQATNNDTLLAIHKVWTPDGQGGDKRGRLLATRNYDDNQCYQVNGGEISTERQKEFFNNNEELWCQADIQLPSDLKVGSTYTLYWVWDWPTFSTDDVPTSESNGTITLTEMYTSCADISLVDPCSIDSPACAGINGTKSALTLASLANTFVKGQPYQESAILSQLEKGNFAVAVPGIEGTNGAADGDSTDGSSSDSDSATTLKTKTRHSHQKTVTVTEGIATVTVTQYVDSSTLAEATSTATVTEGVSTVVVTRFEEATAPVGTASTPVETGAAPLVTSVTPFMARRARWSSGKRSLLGPH